MNPEQQWQPRPQGPPQYGQPQGQPQHGQPQYGQGQPQTGQPQYGQPQYGQGQPQTGQPQYGQQYGQPQNGQPQNGQQYGQGQPQYGQPGPQGQYGPPQYGQPQYGQQYGQPGPPGFPPLQAPGGATAPDHRAAARSAAVRQMVIGGVVALVGLVLTIVTYKAASDGGHYVVAWGPALFGVIAFVRGLVAYTRA